MKHFITFGNESFAYQKQRLKKDATATGWFDSVTVFSPEDIAEFLKDYTEFVKNNRRGYGYWIWKPYVILKTLQQVAEGDTVFYVDSGSSIIPHKKSVFESYVQRLEKENVMVFKLPDYQYTERMFSKIDVLKHYSTSERNLQTDEDFLNSGQVESGLFFCKNTATARKFVKDWLEGMLFENHRLVTDHTQYTESLPGFIEHRHDQSVLSILSKLRGVAVIPTESYGIGPFFSSRISDEGRREFAPDTFRTEQDYDTDKHSLWSEYLKDPKVLSNTVEQYRELLITFQQEGIFGDIEHPVYQQLQTVLIQHTNSTVARKGIYKIQIHLSQPELYSKYCYQEVAGSITVEMLDPSKGYNLFQVTNIRTLYFHLTESDLHTSDLIPYSNVYNSPAVLSYLSINNSYYLEQKKVF